MTPMLHPLAAIMIMSGVPLGFEAGPSITAQTAASGPVIYAAQNSSTAGADAQVRDLEQPPVEAETGDEAAAEVAIESTGDGTLSEGERKEIVRAAADQLSAVETAKGQFTQVAADGRVTHGDFALRRPGRMRFDYDDPTPILIVSDGTTVAMEDRDLETVDRIPLASTPLGLILDDELDFEREARVLDVRRDADRVAVTMEDRTGEAEGQLTLFFSRDGYDLLSWRTVDANRQTTMVTLEDVETNVNIDPRLFILEDPADEEEDER